MIPAERIKSGPDLFGAALLVLIGAAFVAGSLGLEVINQQGRIGPGFMPFATGALLAIFGAMVGAEALLRSRRPPEEEEVPQTARADGEEEGSRHTVAVVFGLTFAAILLIPLLGFLASFGALVFVLVRFIEKGSLFISAALGVGAAALTWAVFVLFLRIPLPMGVFVGG
ncbi:MAG: tripartite tricarboxylate transporter TctB family protein [Rubrobacteraceae bacterium]